MIYKNLIIFLLFTLIGAQNNFTTYPGYTLGMDNGVIQQTMYSFLQTLPAASSVWFLLFLLIIKDFTWLKF